MVIWEIAAVTSTMIEAEITTGNGTATGTECSALFIHKYSVTRCSIRRAVVFGRFLLPIVRQYVQFIIKRQKLSEVDTTGNEPGYYSPPFFMPAYELCGLGVRSQG